MNKQTKVEVPTGLDLLRQPFEPHHISKLPKETRAQIDQRKADKSWMVFNCPVCGGHHHKNAVHLDYVGHAALTDRLLDVDPTWYWEPQGRDERGLPAFDHFGGLWINLTICGVTRPGYGSADGKTGGDAVKEIIGDALRNAAMRFGAALDLWHKGDLHPELPEEGSGTGTRQEDCEVSPTAPTLTDADWSKLAQLIEITKANVPAMLKHLRIVLPDNNLDLLNPAQYARVIAALNEKLAKMAKAETDAKAKEET